MNLTQEQAVRVGRWIVARRKYLDMTQQELATAARRSTSQLTMIERGIVGKRGWHRSTAADYERALLIPHGTLRAIANGSLIDWK